MDENSENRSGGVAVALIDGKIVGCGCLKTHGCSDSFYKIGKQTAYLGVFHTDADYRGCGIYPAVISFLIESNLQYREFFISAYTSNTASIKGLTKVGFVPIKTLEFFRVLKVTVNPYRLCSEGN